METILGWESSGQPRVVSQRPPSPSSASVSAHTRLVLLCASLLGDQAESVGHTFTAFPVTSWTMVERLVLDTKVHCRQTYLHVKVAPVIHGETVRLARLGADLGDGAGDVLVAVEQLRVHPEELAAGEGGEVEVGGAAAGGGHSHAVNVVIRDGESGRRGEEGEGGPRQVGPYQTCKRRLTMSGSCF